MKAESALIGPNGAVEFYPVAAVYVHVAGVVGPRNAEHNGALRLGDALENSRFFVFRILLDEGNDGFGYLVNGLNKLRLSTVTGFCPIHKF